jgi:U3 small nucleolar RNA-associated protein 10
MVRIFSDVMLPLLQLSASDQNIFVKITFCKVYGALLDYFKVRSPHSCCTSQLNRHPQGLMTGYMSFLLPPFKTILARNSTESPEQQALWCSIIEVLTQSLADDEGGEYLAPASDPTFTCGTAFWRDEQLKEIAGPLVAQVPVCVEMGLQNDGVPLQECLSGLVDVVSDDALLKSINLDLLMHTRADEVRLRMYALQCAQVLWQTHGAKLLGMSHCPSRRASADRRARLRGRVRDVRR